MGNYLNRDFTISILETTDVTDNNNESRLKINNDFASSFHNKQAKNIKNLISKSTTCVMVEIFFYWNNL